MVFMVVFWWYFPRFLFPAPWSTPKPYLLHHFFIFALVNLLCWGFSMEVSFHAVNGWKWAIGFACAGYGLCCLLLWHLCFFWWLVCSVPWAQSDGSTRLSKRMATVCSVWFLNLYFLCCSHFTVVLLLV